jgi:hypothetical protein
MAQAMKTPCIRPRPHPRQRLDERSPPRQPHHPDSAKEKPQEGKVLAVGKGTVAEDGKKTLDVKAGTACCSARIPAARSR